LTARGWRRTTLQPGDMITVIAYPLVESKRDTQMKSRDGSVAGRLVHGEEISLEDGLTLNWGCTLRCGGERPDPTLSEASPAAGEEDVRENGQGLPFVLPAYRTRPLPPVRVAPAEAVGVVPPVGKPDNASATAIPPSNPATAAPAARPAEMASMQAWDYYD